MKLAAIYNIFDGEELLPYSVGQIKDECFIKIAVVQNVSNRGNHYTPTFKHSLFDLVVFFEPNLRKTAMQNETDKRNLGIQAAIEAGASHYLLLDCDEIYERREFARLKKLLASARFSACKMYTYYGTPTQRIDPIESYYVPFINELTPLTKVGNNRLYSALCDPTRKDMRLRNSRDLTILNDPIMHHFSWVRKDLRRKFENSTSEVYKGNIDNYVQAVKDNVLVHFDGKLIECKNKFNIDIG